jgi:hypothetical protein
MAQKLVAEFHCNTLVRDWEQAARDLSAQIETSSPGVHWRIVNNNLRIKSSFSLQAK